MKSLKKAQGITLIGFVFVLAILGFFLYAGMQIGPVYMDHFSVVKTMKAEAQESTGKNPGQIKAEMMKRLDISYVQHVKANDFKVLRGNGRELHVEYTVIKPLFYNLSFLMVFKDSVQLDQ